MPPSSRGLGRGPFKAKTGVRIPVGAHPYHDLETQSRCRFRTGSFRLQRRKGWPAKSKILQLKALYTLSIEIDHDFLE